MSEIQEGTLATPLPWKGITIGRIVHYVGMDPYHSAAIVTRVINPEKGVVNLRVFSDLEESFVRSAIPYEEEGQTFQTWHWPERA